MSQWNLEMLVYTLGPRVNHAELVLERLKEAHQVSGDHSPQKSRATASDIAGREPVYVDSRPLKVCRWCGGAPVEPIPAYALCTSCKRKGGNCSTSFAKNSVANLMLLLHCGQQRDGKAVARAGHKIGAAAPPRQSTAVPHPRRPRWLP